MGKYNKVILGSKVYGLFDGTICEGKIISLYTQTLDSMFKGTKYKKGFRVMWNVKSSECEDDETVIREYQRSMYGNCVFNTYADLLKKAAKENITL